MEQKHKELITYLEQHPTDMREGLILPADVWHLVLQYLSFREIYDVSLVNRHFRNTVVPRLLANIGPRLERSLEDYPLINNDTPPARKPNEHERRSTTFRRRLLNPTISPLLRMDELLRKSTRGLNDTHALIIQKIILNHTDAAEHITLDDGQYAANPTTADQLYIPIVDARGVPLVIIAAALGRTKILQQILPPNTDTENVLLRSRNVGQRAG